jgi:hypothetical protein
MGRALVLSVLLMASPTEGLAQGSFAREAEDALRVLEFTKPWSRQPLFALRELHERFTRLAEQARLLPDSGVDPLRAAQLRRRLAAARDELAQALAREEWAALPSEVAATITAKCEQDWPRDFAMRAACQRQQVEGWYQLRR